MTAVAPRAGLAGALLAEDDSADVRAAFESIDWTAPQRFGWRFWVAGFGASGVSLFSPFMINRGLIDVVADELRGVDRLRRADADDLLDAALARLRRAAARMLRDGSNQCFALRDQLAWPAECESRGHTSVPAPGCDCGHYIAGSLAVLADGVRRSARGWSTIRTDPSTVPWVIGRVMSMGATAAAPPSSDDPGTFRATSYVACGPLFLSPAVSRRRKGTAAIEKAFSCPVFPTRARSLDDWLTELAVTVPEDAHR